MNSALACGEIVLNHVVLAYVLDFSREPGSGWDSFERRHINRCALLHLLPALAAISKPLRMYAGLTMQYAALRLASHDLEFGAVKVSARTKAKLLLQAFDLNVDTFSKSWRVDFPVPEKLRVTALGDLQAEELHQLRGILLGGWQHEVAVKQGDGQCVCPNVWVIPACR